MSSELPSQPYGDAVLATTRPGSTESVHLNILGHDITFGLPETEVRGDRELIIIPSTPHIFRVDQLLLRTERENIEHEIRLLGQVILIGHGKRHRDDPRTWFFEDGQDVVQLAADYNSLNNGLPPIKMIVSCRRVLPMTKKGTTFNSTRPPLGWQNLKGVKFQKNGNPQFRAIIRDGMILARVTNPDSDFIRVTKSGRIKNIRKSGI